MKKIHVYLCSSLKNQDRNIILFDGVCNLCNGAVRWVHKRDPKALFQYQSLQSEKGQELLDELNYNGGELKSFVYIKGNELFTKSTAALQVAKTLGSPYSFAQILLIIPPFIRNAVYDFVAANRYKWFGKKKEVCEFDPTFQQKVL